MRELVAIGQPESLTLEYKESFAAKIPDSVAAMANSYGGLILVGVTERNLDDRITGVPESTIVQIVSACHQKLEPPWEPEIIPVPLPDSGGLMVLVVRVDPAQAPRPLLIQGAAPIRLHGRNAVASLPRLIQLITEAPPKLRTIGLRLPPAELPRDTNGQNTADFLVRTGMFVPVDASATWRPLSENAVEAFANAMNSSPLHQALFRWCASLGDGGMNPFHRSGFNRARTVRLLWQGGPNGAEPFPLEAIAKLDLPSSYGAPVSHLQVSLEVVVRIGYALKLPGSPPLAVGALRDLVDSLVTTLVGDPVITALAALAGVDPLVVPQPLGLDFISGPDVPDLLAGNGLTPIPDAGTSHGANLLADPGVDQRDPGERRTLVDNWLQQISLDAGLRGMEQALVRVHAAKDSNA
ncbi:ATP-binding protein [Streptomyces sp. So13.3]|uniref:AlbA family DNA-binding domain-containing protein n=1 Tax=Streptomyces sp. So13.3 TaxID=2136173 RepID=UPI00164DD5DC|nr:ATP-binding protein [Streptomyces sp. So13.3]QNA72006.1 ATP-binding protein [Streptomyces sp. So13.3]